MHTVEATVELLSQLYPAPSTPLRGVYLERSRKAQNDSALMTSDLEVTHDVK